MPRIMHVAAQGAAALVLEDVLSAVVWSLAELCRGGRRAP